MWNAEETVRFVFWRQVHNSKGYWAVDVNAFDKFVYKCGFFDFRVHVCKKRLLYIKAKIVQKKSKKIWY